MVKNSSVWYKSSFFAKCTDWTLKIIQKVTINFQKYVCLYLQTITMMICMSELDSTPAKQRSSSGTCKLQKPSS